MNRDIVSVLLGGFGTKATGGGEAMKIEGEATMTTSSDVAEALTESRTASETRKSFFFLRGGGWILDSWPWVSRLVFGFWVLGFGFGFWFLVSMTLTFLLTSRQIPFGEATACLLVTLITLVLSLSLICVFVASWRQVVIVPGYGLAVAGAQYAIADAVKILTKHGVKVE